MKRFNDPIKDDFRNFLYLVWKHLNLPDPTAVQYDIADYLQHGPKRCIIEAFRGVGKSYVTSAFVVWLLYRDPQLNILVVSASKDRADQFSTFTKRLIAEMPLLAHLRARPGQRDSSIAFDVGPARNSHSPSVKSVGITGQLAGSRADVIIADDVEVPNNSMTETQRQQLAIRVQEFDAILKPLDTSRVIYLGTPQCEMSLYNELLKRNYQIRIWPARVPDKAQIAAYGDRLSPFVFDLIEKGWKAGAPTDPQRFDEDDLFEREASYGRSGFALQFMLDTRLSDAERYPLRVSDLIVMSINPELAPVRLAWAASPEARLELHNVAFNGDHFYRPMWVDKEWTPYTGSVMAIDPSGRGGDETGYAIVKFLNGFLYVTAAGGLPGGYDDDTLLKLATLAKDHQVNHIIVEANFGDGMYTKLLQPVVQRLHPCRIEEVKHSSQKEKRIIDTLEPVLMRHKLVIDPKVIEQDAKSVHIYPADRAQQYMLMYQLTRLTKDRGSLAKDDRIDALAMAVAYWTESMARDADRAAADLREKKLQEELDKFIDGAMGRSGRPRDLWVRV
ncbi:hypothetical protein Ga0061061_1179 [Chelatococcus sambhunathii]|uniref:Terminase large subunit ribonuclease H-like domain-containing protein n=1 Tax=Chelatococcus sambhunathii TaxID=363953 RepID=A0ABM9U9F9_9HYPH|nr:phage terminase large subunit [Chelatococcus sambhunathii]CUA90948.1 hypothetical protein Ga0061061_1179 [Chelatococcus sambhunathii]